MKSGIIRVMEGAVIKAGRRLLRDFGEVEKLQVSQKGPGDFVSTADTEAQKTLTWELQKARPDYGFLVEEGEEIKGKDASYRWIIDPLDGTTNFLHGLPFFCISVALEKRLPNKKPDIEAAMIFAPVFNELFWAGKGEGAYVNDERLKVSARVKLDISAVGTGGVAINRADRLATEAAIQAVAEKVAAVRILGSAALELAYVAAGRLEAYWHSTMKPWDVAAAILLIREAHGMVTEIGGGSRALETGSILATNGHVHKEIDSLVAPHYKQ